MESEHFNIHPPQISARYFSGFSELSSAPKHIHKSSNVDIKMAGFNRKILFLRPWNDAIECFIT